MTQNNNFNTMSFLIQEILDQKSNIETLIKLKRDGYKFYFAPDTSEIKNYTAPYLDITESYLEKDIRRWYATKALLESNENENILIPPYIFEINLILGVIRDKIKNPGDLAQPINALLKNTEFNNLLSELSKSETNKAEILLNLEKQFGKELGLLYELVARHKEIDQWNKLRNSGKLKSALGLFDYLDNEKIISDSIIWQLAIEDERYKFGKKQKHNFRINRRNVEAKSHFDGWAIEYLIQANKYAQKRSGGRNDPFVIFVSRSSTIERVAGKNLEFGIEGIGNLKVFWSPDTYLAYHLIVQSSRMNQEQIIDSLNELYLVGKNLKETKDASLNNSIINDLIASNNLISSIENISMFYEKVNDNDFTDHIDIWELQKYQPEKQVKLLENVLNFIHDQDINVIKSQLENNIDKLWLEFSVSLFSTSISQINGVKHLVIKSPGHRIWIRFKSHHLIEWVNNKQNILATELDILEKLAVQEQLTAEETNFLQIIIFLLTGKIDSFNDALKVSIKSKDVNIQREVVLLNLSMAFMLNKRFLPSIDESQMHKSDLSGDPRLDKILSLLAWNEWKISKNSDDLILACTHAQNALNLVDESSEFKVECLNNLAYYQTLQFEMLEKKQSEINNLILTLDSLEQLCKNVYEESDYPVEISHTIGKLQLIIANKKTDITLREQIETLMLAEQNLSKSFHFEPGNKVYKEDFIKVREKLRDAKRQQD